MKLHPFFVLVLALPVFVIQMSTILALRYDLDVTVSINSGPNDDKALNDLAWCLKLLMVVILQLTQFSDMFASLRLLVFLCNPLTWVEMQHPTPAEWLDKNLKSQCARTFGDHTVCPHPHLEHLSDLWDDLWDSNIECVISH